MELLWQNETANAQPLNEFHSWISPEDAINPAVPSVFLT